MGQCGGQEGCRRCAVRPRNRKRRQREPSRAAIGAVKARRSAHAGLGNLTNQMGILIDSVAVRNMGCYTSVLLGLFLPALAGAQTLNCSFQGYKPLDGLKAEMPRWFVGSDLAGRAGSDTARHTGGQRRPTRGPRVGRRERRQVVHTWTRSHSRIPGHHRPAAHLRPAGSAPAPTGHLHARNH